MQYYYPFGKESRSSSSSNKPREQFTGKERDAESGLDYFGARYYNAEIGRWMSVDPLNQYASGYVYVGNNPIRMIDPTGMEGESTGDDEKKKENGLWNSIKNSVGNYFTSGQQQQEENAGMSGQADQQVQGVVSSTIEGLQIASDVGHLTLQEQSQKLDVVSDVLNVAGAGAVASGNIPAFGVISTVNTLVDAANTAVLATDAAFFGGSWGDAQTQAVKTGTGFLASNVALELGQKQVIKETGNVVGAEYRASRSIGALGLRGGAYVKNEYAATVIGVKSAIDAVASMTILK
ncbi:RHS repeat-associated core domain-containing protein [bacterium]|nr:RHS repeat-associated core domain-containing protein [bacterium]